MKIELEDKSATKKELKLEIPGEAFKDPYNKVCAQVRGSATIPGFRKGNAPIAQVAVHYKEKIQENVLREVVGSSVQKAIAEKGLTPLTEPQLHFEDFDNIIVDGSASVKLHVHVEVMCEVPVPTYKGIEVARRIKPVPTDDPDKVIDDLRNRGAALIPVEDRKSAEGDTVTVDLVGTFVGDESADPITAENVDIAIGDANIEASFTENLAGLGVDEVKEFTVSYAEDFGSANLAGKTVTYKATVKGIAKKELPELNDEWAKSLEGEYESVKDLREKIARDLETMSKADADARVRNDVVSKLVEKHEFEVPESFVENQTYNLLNKWASDLAQRGMDPKQLDQQFVQMIYTQMRPQAELDVRGSMLLEKVAEIEQVAVTDEDVEGEVVKISAYYRMPTEEIRKALAADGGVDNIKRQLKTKKTIEAIVAHAVITDEPWVDESEEPVPVDMEKKLAKAEESAG